MVKGTNLQVDLPVYPGLLQLLRVTVGTIPGPTGGSSTGIGTGTVPPAVLYIASTQQLRTDTLSPRDREPCLVVDVGGVGLIAGYYLGRLAGSYQSLPVYEVAITSSGGGSSIPGPVGPIGPIGPIGTGTTGPQGPAGSSGLLPGLTTAQLATINASLTPGQLGTLNNLNACQLQVLMQLPVVNLQILGSSLTPTQLSNVVDWLTFSQLKPIVTQLPTSQILSVSSAYPQLYQAINQALTPTQSLALFTNLSSQQLSTLSSLTMVQLQVVAQLSLAQIQVLTSLTQLQVTILVGQLTVVQLNALLVGLTLVQLVYLTNNLTSVDIFVLMQRLTVAQIVVMILDLTIVAYVANLWINMAGGGSTVTIWFGDGSDGAVTFDGVATILGMVPVANVYSMTRDILCTTIIINNGVTLKPKGFWILCNDTLTNNSTTGISAAGGAGGTDGTGFPAAAGAAGTNSVPGASGTFQMSSGSNPGGAGGAMSSGGANGGTPSETVGGYGGVGGVGGAATNGGGTGGGGSFTAPPAVAGTIRRLPQCLEPRPLYSVERWRLAGGGGGGGGCDSMTSAGGGGGGGGSAIGIAAKTIINNGGITAAGGFGGNGAGSASNAGGGGGGGGGVIVTISSSFTGNAPTVDGGDGGSGFGTGAVGLVGNDGVLVQFTA